MVPEVSAARRWRSHQKDEIAKTRELRDQAVELRDRVAKGGQYGPVELQQFWSLTSTAGLILHTSNPELGALAGVGSGFFSSVARDERRPKLENFFRALKAIIEVANERLADVEDKKPLESLNIYSADEIQQLLVMARALSQLAADELTSLRQERPNDPDAIERNTKQQELFARFVNGFDRIVEVLSRLSEKPVDQKLADRAARTINAVAAELNHWFDKHRRDLSDWGVRIPVMAAGVSLMGWAGADMTVATTVVGALVGGPKVLETLRQGE